MKIRNFFLIFFLFSFIALGAQEQQYIRHKVRWMETLYSIARKYKVDAKEIAILNNLKTGDISRGQILLIPDLEAAEKQDITDNIQETITEVDLPQPEEKPDRSCDNVIPAGSYTPVVSVILPFSDTIAGKEFIEFYQGASPGSRRNERTGHAACIAGIRLVAATSRYLVVRVKPGKKLILSLARCMPMTLEAPFPIFATVT